VDVRQAVRAASPDPAGTGSTQISTSALNLGEPRKVRTVAVGRDGTVITPDAVQPPPRPAPQQVASLQPPAAAPAAAPSAPATTPAAVPTPAPRPVAATPAPAPRAAPATPTTSAGTSPQAQAQTPSAKPAPAAPQRVASALPNAAPAPSATEAVASGSFAVQLGVSGSESDAKATLQRMQSKYSDLGSVPGLIRKAEVNGNTVYRVRVGPMGREEASSLCSKIQGQGGQCFVAKN